MVRNTPVVPASDRRTWLIGDGATAVGCSAAGRRHGADLPGHLATLEPHLPVEREHVLPR
jgi:NADPH-dependent glutamate synthase beta subunit-like oxidoreductase